MNLHLSTAVGLFLLSWVCPPAIGADIYRSGKWMVIEGEIRPGDFETFKNLTASALSAIEGTVYLASPGGNVAEAMKIGLLVRKLRWTTFAPIRHSDPAVERGLAEGVGLRNVERNNVCASACFMIFVAGAQRLGSKLGIHRPYFGAGYLRSAEGDEVVDQAKRGVQIVEAYLRDMDIPPKYAELMFQVPKDEIKWLTREEQEDIQTLIPGLHDWIESKCGLDPHHPRIKPRRGATNAEFEKWGTYFEKHSNCRSEALQEMRVSAWIKYRKEEKK